MKRLKIWINDDVIDYVFLTNYDYIVLKFSLMNPLTQFVSIQDQTGFEWIIKKSSIQKISVTNRQ